MSRAAVAGCALALGAGLVGAPAEAAPVPSSTSLVLSVPQSVYGQTVRASAAVATTGETPQGDVVFAVDGTSVTANLTAGGTATILLPRLLVGSHAVTATFVPQSAAQAGSTSPTTTWTVAPAPTHLLLAVRGRRPGARTTVRVQVDGDHGTHPTGRVRVVARRGDGHRVRVVRTLGASSVAEASLGRLRAGAYRLTVTYLGDPQHLRGRRVQRLRIGR